MDIAEPIRIVNGTIATSEASTGDHVRIFLQTLMGERLLYPEYGLPDLVFQPLGVAAVEAIIIANLARSFPGVSFEVSGRMNPTGTIHLSISWVADSISIEL